MRPARRSWRFWGAGRLAERLGSRYSKHHAGEFKEPNSFSIEAFALVRWGLALKAILEDLACPILDSGHVERVLKRVCESSVGCIG
jgi:hypothetical protein